MACRRLKIRRLSSFFIDFRAHLKKVKIDNIAGRDSLISTSKDAIRN